MVVSPVFPCGYSCTLCVESFKSLKSFGMEPVVPSSIPIVVLMMIPDDDMNYHMLNTYVAIMNYQC